MKTKAFEWLFGAIFTFVGVVFLIVGVFLVLSDIEFKNRAIEHTAVISEITTHRDSDGDNRHTVYVKYSIEGQTYEERLDFYNIGMYEGKEITIYYDPLDPGHIMAKSGFPFSFFFPLFGLVFFVIGLASILIKVRKIKTFKSLKENGQIVYAEISEITLNRSYRVNGRNPFIIICKWTNPSTGLIYFFRSGNIWFDPGPIINDRQIKSLQVYIDRENPKRYVVSVEDLEKLVAVV